MTPDSTGPQSPLAPSAEQIEAARSLAGEAPWIDVHAHPGRCFLGGLPADDPLAIGLGGDAARAAVAEIAAAGVAAVAFSTVADLRVLQVTERGLAAGREFRPGEARDDHDRQIDAVASLADDGEVLLVRSASDLDRAHREGRVGMVLSCEGADFLDGRLDGLGDAHRSRGPVDHARALPRQRGR